MKKNRTQKMRKDEMLKKVNERRTILETIKQRKETLGHWLHRKRQKNAIAEEEEDESNSFTVLRKINLTLRLKRKHNMGRTSNFYDSIIETATTDHNTTVVFSRIPKFYVNLANI